MTTGRKRKVNYLNLDKLIIAINISGTTNLIVSKIDILRRVGIFKYIYEEKVWTFDTIEEMIENITRILTEKCTGMKQLIFSESPEKV